MILLLLNFLDASKGFGGKFGLQENGQDKNAVGYEYKDKLAAHSSQKGSYKGTLYIFSNLFLFVL